MVAKLKENKIYNYGYFFKPEIRVFANEKTINLIKEGRINTPLLLII